MEHYNSPDYVRETRLQRLEDERECVVGPTVHAGLKMKDVDGVFFVIVIVVVVLIRNKLSL
jgi:hypothetical protein